MQHEIPFSSLSPRHSRQNTGYTNGVPQGVNSPALIDKSDEFLQLSQPQQDVLLLHGPGKRYSLEKQKDIPTLKTDREVLIQVLAIGLNPVDWKGPDYGIVVLGH